MLNNYKMKLELKLNIHQLHTDNTDSVVNSDPLANLPPHPEMSELDNISPIITSTQGGFQNVKLERL